MQDPKAKLVGQNCKFDYKILTRWGIKPTNIFFDTMIAAWVLDSTRSSYGLDSLAETHLHYRTMHYDEVTGGKSLVDLDIRTVTDYSGEDADITFRLFTKLSDLLDGPLRKLFYTVEMPLVAILADMELAGIVIQTEKLLTYGQEIEVLLKDIEGKIFSLCGKMFNINSTKQLQEILFVDLDLEPVKKTKTGFSTDTWVLETLAGQHAVPKLVLRHRTLTKLKSTYVSSLPQLVSPTTGRLHTHFIQTGTATGRLSSKKPNLQNIPVREEEGRRIRNAFVPIQGFVFLSADYSQIELAILTYLSQDSILLRAFQEGRDIHNQTASLIFQVPEDAVTPVQRRIGKTINFGVIYGMSAFRLARDLEISRSLANSFIETYFQRYAGVDTYIKKVSESAMERGWVETIMGRRRSLPGINSNNRTVKMAAARVAVNTPIQGSAADIVKIAMIRVTHRLQNEGYRTKLLLQVHDELIFEVPEEELAHVTPLIKDTMEHAIAHDIPDIPLKVRIVSGESWGVL